MKNNFFLIVVIGIAITILLLFSINKFESNHKEVRLYSSDREDSLSKKSIEVDSLKNLTLYNYEKQMSFKKLLDKDLKLIVAFSSFQCSYCIDHVLNTLKKFEKYIDKDKIILLGEFNNKHDYYRFKELNNITIPFFFFKHKQGFNLPVKELNVPYVIITNSTLKPELVFVPMKEIPKRTDIYFSIISKKI